MKLNSMLLTLTAVAATALSACGAPQTAAFMPAAQRLQAASVSTHRAVAGQLTYAREMRGFSSIQNPMRTMMLEYITPSGQKMSMHADRFTNYPEFNISLIIDSNPNLDHGAQYFSSKDKVKVQALIDTLQSLDTSAADAATRESLARIFDHLKSAL